MSRLIRCDQEYRHVHICSISRSKKAIFILLSLDVPAPL